MKLSNIDLFNFSKSYIFFTQASNRKMITKYNLFTNEKEELELYNDYIDFRRIDKNKFIVKSNYGSIIFDNNLERIKTYFIGSPIFNFHYIKYSFLQPTIFQGEKNLNYNVILDEETRQFTTLPITEDIKFYEFHDEYFIPVTYMNAAQGHSYGPELSVYNYQGELVWSKDFREPDTYINSVPVFHDELSVNSNVKICDDYVVVSTSTNHLFCYDIHTGKQIWRQNQFAGPFPNPQMVALDTEQKMIFVWMYMTFHKIDLLTGQIILSKDMWEWQDRFRHGYVSWTVTKDGLWSATQSYGVVACINKDTLDIDKTYQLESHGTINDSAAPHVTDQFIVIPDGLGNLEIIKRN
jgi:hypothetical protein